MTFTISGPDALQCDDLTTNTVRMSGGVANLQGHLSPAGHGLARDGTGDLLGRCHLRIERRPSHVERRLRLLGALTPPASIPDDCSSDAAPALLTWLASLPQRTPSNPLVVRFPPLACYVVNETLLLQGATDLTIDGNGATFEQPAQDGASPAPILELWEDTNLKINNLTIKGGFDGTNGGEGFESDYGIQMEADNGVLLSQDTVEDIQGDWVYLSPPYDLSDTDALSTNITLTSDTFLNAGYHGFTVESVGCLTIKACNGLTIQASTMTNIDVDAMDFEYDDYSTGWQTSTGASCTPTATNAATCLPFWAAQDYVTIENNTWNNWGNDWFASVQGQVPGVQETNLKLMNNTLVGDSAIFEVEGTNRYATGAAGLNTDWTITGNHFAPGYFGKAYRGGNSVAGELHSISNLTITGNTFPLCNGQYEEPQPLSTCGSPNQYVFDLDLIVGGTITGNNFAGSQGVALPQPYDRNLFDLSACGNAIGPADHVGCRVPDARVVRAAPEDQSRRAAFDR